MLAAGPHYQSPHKGTARSGIICNLKFILWLRTFMAPSTFQVTGLQTEGTYTHSVLPHCKLSDLNISNTRDYDKSSQPKLYLEYGRFLLTYSLTRNNVHGLILIHPTSL